MSQERTLPKSRQSRLWQMGKLAGGMVSGAISESVKLARQGDKPSMRKAFLTPDNMRRIGDRLSEMRGAAMKIGQLISMEGGELLPPELSALLERLRENAHSMPLGEVAAVLKTAWGENWQTQFTHFSFTPIAAASIGQVHEATLKDGRKLAIKLQYPGVKQSIDSDVDNVATLLSWLNLLPKEMDVESLLKEAKHQLHLEADYRHEARMLALFAQQADPRFYQIPTILDALSCDTVLAMDYLEGIPVKEVFDAQRAIREQVGEHYLALALKEVFVTGVVQTDPNFANYRYEPDSKRLQLLDFGATREYATQRRDTLKLLLRGSLEADRDQLNQASTQLGYVIQDDPEAFKQGMVNLLMLVSTPLREPVYDFSRSNLAQEMKDMVLDLRVDQGYSRVPPTDILYLHRKLGGLYMMLKALKVKLPVRELCQAILADDENTPGDT